MESSTDSSQEGVDFQRDMVEWLNGRNQVLANTCEESLQTCKRDWFNERGEASNHAVIGSNNVNPTSNGYHRDDYYIPYIEIESDDDDDDDVVVVDIIDDDDDDENEDIAFLDLTDSQDIQETSGSNNLADKTDFNGSFNTSLMSPCSIVDIEKGTQGMQGNNSQNNQGIICSNLQNNEEVICSNLQNNEEVRCSNSQNNEEVTYGNLQNNEEVICSNLQNNEEMIYGNLQNNVEICGNLQNNDKALFNNSQNDNVVCRDNSVSKEVTCDNSQNTEETICYNNNNEIISLPSDSDDVMDSDVLSVVVNLSDSILSDEVEHSGILCNGDHNDILCNGDDISPTESFSILSSFNIVDTKGEFVSVNSELNESSLTNHSFLSILSPFVPSDNGYIADNGDADDAACAKVKESNIADTEKCFIDLSLGKNKRKKKKKKKGGTPKRLPAHILSRIIQEKRWNRNQKKLQEENKKKLEKYHVKKDEIKEECKVEETCHEVSPATMEVTSAGRTLGIQTVSVFRIAIKDETDSIKQENGG